MSPDDESAYLSRLALITSTSPAEPRAVVVPEQSSGPRDAPDLPARGPERSRR